MRTTTVKLPRLPERAHALHVVLNPLHSARFAVAEASRGIALEPYPRKNARGRPPANILRFRLTGEQPVIALRSSWTAPQVLKVVVRDAGGRVLSVHDETRPAGYSKADVDSDPGISEELSSEDFLVRVSDAIDGIKNDVAKRNASSFFFDYDLHFNPGLWEKLEAEGADPLDWVYADMFASEQEMRDLATAFGVVMTRLEVRTNERRDGLPTSWDPNEQAEVELLSRLQLALYEYYQDVVGMSLAGDIGRAFDRFSGGELRLPFSSLGTLEPSSGIQFFFAEFALLAMNHGLKKSMWKTRARFLLRSQEIMAEVYAPPGIPGPSRNDTHYRAENFDSTKNPSLATLEAKYAALTTEAALDAQATQNIRDHMGLGLA